MNDYTVQFGDVEFLNLDTVMGNNIDFKVPKPPHESDWAEENTKYSVEKKYKMLLLQLDYDSHSHAWSAYYNQHKNLPEGHELKKYWSDKMDEESSAKDKLYFQYLALRDSK